MYKRDRSVLILRNSDGLGLEHGQSHMNRIGNVSYDFGYSEDGIGLGYGQSPKAKAKKIGYGVKAGLCKNFYINSDKRHDIQIDNKLLELKWMIKEVDDTILGQFGPFIVRDKRAKDNVIFQDDSTYRSQFKPKDNDPDSVPGYYCPDEDTIYINKETKSHSSDENYLEAVFCHEAIHFYTHKNFYNIEHILAPCKITGRQLIDGATEYFSHEVLDVLAIDTGCYHIDNTYYYETLWVESVIIKKTENLEKEEKIFFEGDYDNSIGREIMLRKAFFQGDLDSRNRIKAIVESSKKNLYTGEPINIPGIIISAPKKQR